MAVHSYQCPNCGAPLMWDAGEGHIDCDYCLSEFTIEEIEAFQTKLQAQLAQEQTASSADPEYSSEDYRSYHCNNCGAEVVTDEVTSATFCYYCHSPVILTSRVSGKFKPQAIIPFQINQERAVEIFLAWAKQRRFIPPSFYSESQLEKMSGLYLPLWEAKVRSRIDLLAQGQTQRKLSGNQEEITDYRIVRQGDVTLDKLIALGFSEADKIQPEAFLSVSNYDFAESRTFSPAYLSGYYAELWSVTQEEAATEVKQRAADYAEQNLLQELRSSYDSVQVQKSSFVPHVENINYLLAPAWVLTYAYGDRRYVYVINGQNGKTVGELPLDKVKLWRTAAVISLILLVLLLLGGWFIW